jgi:hypothetical protein
MKLIFHVDETLGLVFYCMPWTALIWCDRVIDDYSIIDDYPATGNVSPV